MNPSVAATGFGVLMGERARQHYSSAPSVGAQIPPVIGITSPSTVLNRLTEVDTAVQTTNSAIGLKPPTGPQGQDFITRWKAWYDNWNQFVATQRSLLNLLSPAAWLAESDETAREIEARARQHDQLRAEYVHMGGQVIGPDVPPIPTPKSGFTLPWWVWTLGGVAVVGVGYYLYRTYIGKPLEIAKSIRGAHDVPANDHPIRFVRQGSPEPHAMASYPQGIPLSVSDVASHPMPAHQPIVYRPYQHPHVVAGDRHDPPQPFRSSLDGYRDPSTYGGGFGGDDFENDWEDD